MCSKNFTRSDNLQTHEKLHAKRKHLIEPIAPSEPSKQNEVIARKLQTLELRMSTDEAKFKCLNCGKGCSSRFSLLRHQSSGCKKNQKGKIF